LRSTGLPFVDGTTFGRFHRKEIGMSMSSAADSLARTSVAPGPSPGFQAKGQGFGSSTRGSFASYDRDTSSWRTSQLSLFGGSIVFSEPWPRSGMTRSGIAYRLPTLAHRKAGIEYGLLPTLTAGDAKGARNATAPGRSSADGQTMTDWLWLNIGQGMLDPGSAEQMMGFPIGWTDLGDSEMRSCRKSRNGSAVESRKRPK
jgi:hypothetical protein